MQRRRASPPVRRGSRQGSRGRNVPTRVYETLGTQERSPTRVNATRGVARVARGCIGRKRTGQVGAPLRREIYCPKGLLEQSSPSREARVPLAPIAPLRGAEVAGPQPTVAYHNGKSGRLPGFARQRDCPAQNNTRLALAGVQEETDKAERAKRFHERGRLHLLAEGHVRDDTTFLKRMSKLLNPRAPRARPAAPRHALQRRPTVQTLLRSDGTDVRTV
jgi:hypothetical protein